MGPQFFVDGGFVCTYKGITRLLGRGSVRITPHTRGKGCKVRKEFAAKGITPAHAGKSIPALTRHGCWGDHPRACGEKAPPAQTTTHVEGSPPRVRGKVLLCYKLIVIVGITPARAGKSCLSTIPVFAPGDHPRACGEKKIPESAFDNAVGSPPHTRGKD